MLVAKKQCAIVGSTYMKNSHKYGARRPPILGNSKAAVKAVDVIYSLTLLLLTSLGGRTVKRKPIDTSVEANRDRKVWEAYTPLP